VKPYQDKYQRERRLLALDALGKFSLVDTYVLILFVVAFRFHLEVSENLGIDVFVKPTYGFFSFLLATCLSMLLGHASVYCHRRSKLHHRVGNDSLSRESILEHAFEGPEGSLPRRLGRPFQVLLLSSLVVTLILLVVGFQKEFFTFQFGGIAEFVLGDDDNSASYSVLSLGGAILQSVENPQSLGIAFLQGAYYFYTVLTPILCLFVLLILMVWPMALKHQRRFLVVAEIANAWSAIEVFLLSIVAALLQISSFASFMIGDKCDLINRLAAEMFYDRDVDTTCFNVDASVESACWYLILGAILNSSLVSLCLRLSHAALEERTARSSTDQEQSFVIGSHVGDNHGWSMVQKLIGIPLIGSILFPPVANPFTVIEEEVNLLDDDEAETDGEI
jgi:hypothetical protein